jgi:signal transduction histidine kinase
VERALAKAIEMTQVAFEDLRELAHGIYPAVLAEAGLAAALSTLADTATLPVELATLDGRRYPPTVETTAYFTVAEALDDAVGRDADHAAASVVYGDGRLVVTVEDDGTDRSSMIVALADRVGALGGSVEFGPKALRAEIPCA